MYIMAKGPEFIFMGVAGLICYFFLPGKSMGKGMRGAKLFHEVSKDLIYINIAGS